MCSSANCKQAQPFEGVGQYNYVVTNGTNEYLLRSELIEQGASALPDEECSDPRDSAATKEYVQQHAA